MRTPPGKGNYAKKFLKGANPPSDELAAGGQTEAPPPNPEWTELSPRDALIERAKYGQITGEEADAEAVRLGLGGLSRTPGETEFRPDALPQWTLPMAVAWIAYLDLDKVREWSVSYRDRCFDWHWQRWRVGPQGPEYEGWHLQQRARPTLALLGVSSAVSLGDETDPALSVGQAEKALWVALQEGFFAASGIDTDTGKRVVIPPIEWHELVPVETKNKTDEVRRGLLGTGYRDILLPSKSLRGYWRKMQRPQYILPPTTPPAGFGFMPLYCAAQWIATDGGQREIDPGDIEVWRGAFDALLSAISSDAVKVVGVHGNETKPIPPHLFVGIQVDLPFVEASFEILTSNELVLVSCPYLDDEHWRKGFDDRLVNRRHDDWTRLSVQKSDVATLWPGNATVPVVSGAPGRPTSMHLVLIELQRRAEAGEMLTSIVAESKVLSTWLSSTHPAMPQAKAKAIEAGIRDRYWQLRGGKS